MAGGFGIPLTSALMYYLGIIDQALGAAREAYLDLGKELILGYTAPGYFLQTANFSLEQIVRVIQELKRHISGLAPFAERKQILKFLDGREKFAADLAKHIEKWANAEGKAREGGIVPPDGFNTASDMARSMQVNIRQELKNQFGALFEMMGLP